MNTDGSAFQIIYNFCSDITCGDLRQTASSLVTGSDGNLYGVINPGGSAYGSLFRITPSTGAYAMVVNFDFSTAGGFADSLTLAPDGTIYVISVGLPSLLLHYTPSTGDLTTATVTFPLIDGELPSAPGFGITFGPNGNLYGLYQIYATDGMGLYEVAPDGSNLQLFPFYTTLVEGGSPDGLILASDGNFWTANLYGNVRNNEGGKGNIIALSPDNGTLIHNLTPFSKSSAVGAYPQELIQAADGTLWGTTYEFGVASTGQFGDGTVFSVNLGLPPR